MYKCYNCGCENVIWQSDNSPEDFGYEWEGVIQNYMCPQCNASISFEIPSDTKESKEELK